MKRRPYIILIIFLSFLISLGFVIPLITAQEIKHDESKIITTGESKIWIEPNRARVFLGIETLSEIIDVARQENASKIKKVMEALKALNIEGMLIKAPSYNVSLVKEPEYEATRAGRLPKIIGYKVTQDFTALLKNEDTLILSKNAAQVIDTALNSGVNIIQNVEFFKDDDSQDRRNAITLAVKDALSTAKTIADAAGVSVKDYTLIDSSTGYWQPRYRMAQMTQAYSAEDIAQVPTTLVAGKIAITCQVRLHCTIK